MDAIVFWTAMQSLATVAQLLRGRGRPEAADIEADLDVVRRGVEEMLALPGTLLWSKDVHRFAQGLVAQMPDFRERVVAALAAGDLETARRLWRHLFQGGPGLPYIELSGVLGSPPAQAAAAGLSQPWGSLVTASLQVRDILWLSPEAGRLQAPRCAGLVDDMEAYAKAILINADQFLRGEIRTLEAVARQLTAGGSR